MAKKKTPDTGPDQVRVLKLRLDEEEMQTVRVAAAIENLRPGVFSRQVVLERAKEIIADFREA